MYVGGKTSEREPSPPYSGPSATIDWSIPLLPPSTCCLSLISPVSPDRWNMDLVIECETSPFSQNTLGMDNDAC